MPGVDLACALRCIVDSRSGSLAFAWLLFLLFFLGDLQIALTIFAYIQAFAPMSLDTLTVASVAEITVDESLLGQPVDIPDTGLFPGGFAAIRS